MQDDEDGPEVQGPMLPGEMAKMSKLFDDPDKLNLVRRTVPQHSNRYFSSCPLQVSTVHNCNRCDLTKSSRQVFMPPCSLQLIKVDKSA